MTFYCHVDIITSKEEETYDYFFECINTDHWFGDMRVTKPFWKFEAVKRAFVSYLQYSSSNLHLSSLNPMVKVIGDITNNCVQINMHPLYYYKLHS